MTFTQGMRKAHAASARLLFLLLPALLLLLLAACAALFAVRQPRSRALQVADDGRHVRVDLRAFHKLRQVQLAEWAWLDNLGLAHGAPGRGSALARVRNSDELGLEARLPAHAESARVRSTAAWGQGRRDAAAPCKTCGRTACSAARTARCHRACSRTLSAAAAAQ
jgi:hypothetical protein